MLRSEHENHKKVRADTERFLSLRLANRSEWLSKARSGIREETTKVAAAACAVARTPSGATIMPVAIASTANARCPD